MRADRLLSILLMLQTGKRLTAREIAARLEVSERTVLRDMSALGTAGVPVAAERGSGGGWYLCGPYRTDLTGLSTDEAEAVFAARQAGHIVKDLGMGRASEGAFVKLLAALPAISREGARQAYALLHVDVPGWRASASAEDPAETGPLPDLYRACRLGRRARFTYTRAGGEAAPRSVSPLGLVSKGRAWYVVCLPDGGDGSDRGGIRTYRVSRIADLTVTDEPAAPRPPGFDLAEHWDRSQREFKGALPVYRATLRVDPTLAETLQRGRPLRDAVWSDAAPGDPDPRPTLDADFEVGGEARAWALRHGAGVEVVSPSELRDAVAEELRRAADRYGRARPAVRPTSEVSGGAAETDGFPTASGDAPSPTSTNPAQ